MGNYPKKEKVWNEKEEKVTQKTEKFKTKKGKDAFQVKEFSNMKEKLVNNNADVWFK